MSESDRKRFNLRIEDISNYHWQDVISDEPEKDCLAYWSAFNKAASLQKEKGDELGVRVYSFFSVIASFHSRGDSEANPYGPMWSGIDGKRSLQPDDLEEQDLDLLKELVNEIKDPEFRSRVADVLWVTRKDFKCAQIAVGALVESAEQLKKAKGDNWVPFVERLDRAAQIAAIKGFEVQCRQVLDVVEQTILEYKDNPDCGFEILRLMRILLKLDVEDRAQNAQLAEDLAKKFERAEDWRPAQEYWRIAKDWHQRLRDESEVQRCELAAAECDVSNAEGIIATGKPLMSAAGLLSRGFEALRQAKAAPERIQAVHGKLLKVQQDSMKEMNTIELSEDQIPGMQKERERVQEASRELVSRIPLQKALERIALAFRPTDFEALKKRDKEQMQNSVLSRILGASMMDASGKVSDHMPGISPGEEEDPTIKRKRLIQSARNVDWNMAVEWRIEPARVQIVHEHPVRTRDLLYLVQNNPFIEPGHEGIYLHGIQAGFFGDWLVAMHLLVPQIESSIRYILKQKGVVTSTMDSENIQQERDLNQLLWMSEVEDIFGQNILFDLRGILIERFGCNLRNELAHGLMPEGVFYTAEAPYMWWLILHLLYIGHIKIRRDENVSET